MKKDKVRKIISGAEVSRFCDNCRTEKRQSCVKFGEKWVCSSCLETASTMLKKAKPYTKYAIVSLEMDGIFEKKPVLSIEEDGMEFFTGDDTPENRKKLNLVCDALNYYNKYKQSKEVVYE